MTRPITRGRCTFCGYRWPLTKAGRLQQHWLWDGDKRKVLCAGRGSLPESAYANPLRDHPINPANPEH